MTGALPWFKFYPASWMADTGLRACSAAARGLWIDLICIMHDAKPYGHLLINGKRPSYHQISQRLGMDVRTVRNSMKQLERNGVFTCSSTGEITSRKMVRDHAKNQRGKEFSKKRWGVGPNALEDRKKERGPTKESKGRKNGHRWEIDLLRQIGPDAFAEAMDVLAANPALVERATKAELRKPGSGVMAAMIGLQRVTP